MTSPRVGLFVEGAPAADRIGSARLTALWEALALRACALDAVPTGRLFVVGFSKGQLTALSPLCPKLPERSSQENVDVLIERTVRDRRLTHVVVAFDERPPNQYLAPACLRSEVNFLLEALAAQPYLPEPFRRDARALVEAYAASPRSPRGRGHPPRRRVEVLYMRPEFEALLVSNDAALKKALGIKRRPADWPSLSGQKPKDTLDRVLNTLNATQFAALVADAGGGRMTSNPHGWGRVIVERAPPRMFQHEIATRLNLLLADLLGEPGGAPRGA